MLSRSRLSRYTWTAPAKTARCSGQAAIDQPRPRRLTPVECERLQGFPDDWTRYYHDGKQVADGPRYRMLGNAVTVNVAEWIGKRIMESDEVVPGRKAVVWEVT